MTVYSCRNCDFEVDIDDSDPIDEGFDAIDAHEDYYNHTVVEE
jgi:hypothetical protein